MPYQVAIGNHEYDWKTGQEKKHRSTQVDASGNKKPYEPDWGNFGRLSQSPSLIGHEQAVISCSSSVAHLHLRRKASVYTTHISLPSADCKAEPLYAFLKASSGPLPSMVTAELSPLSEKPMSCTRA